MTYVVDETETSSTRKHVPTPEVAPAEPTDERRQNEAHADDEGAVPAVLPPHDFVLAQVTDVGDTGPATGLDEHPTDVRIPEALVGVVGVERRIGVAMVGTVAARPPLDRTLDSAGASDREEVLERLGRVVCTVRPKPVVTSGDTYAHLEFGLFRNVMTTHQDRSRSSRTR